MRHPHWQYFLALEKDFEIATRYVEISPDNFNTYSIELAHLLLASSSEVDVVAKALCEKLDPDGKFENIADYRRQLNQSYPLFHSFVITLPRYDLERRPWESIKRDESPPWWLAYNKVKHQRHNEYKQANLENAIDSLAALMALTLYLYHEDLFHLRLEPWSTVFSIEIVIDNIVSGRYGLPDFPEGR